MAKAKESIGFYDDRFGKISYEPDEHMFLFRFTEILGFGNRPNHDENSSESSQSEISVPDGYLIAMPNFIGRMRNDVEGNSQYADFTIVFEEENNSEYVEGMIFEQSVKYKTEVEKGSTVVLKVSKGYEKVEMPSFVGSTIEETTEKLSELGINYQLEDIVHLYSLHN